MKRSSFDASKVSFLKFLECFRGATCFFVPTCREPEQEGGRGAGGEAAEEAAEIAAEMAGESGKRAAESGRRAELCASAVSFSFFSPLSSLHPSILQLVSLFYSSL
jgi:hypothetical protein